MPRYRKKIDGKLPEEIHFGSVRYRFEEFNHYGTVGIRVVKQSPSRPWITLVEAMHPTAMFGQLIVGIEVRADSPLDKVMKKLVEHGSFEVVPN